MSDTLCGPACNRLKRRQNLFQYKAMSAGFTWECGYLVLLYRYIPGTRGLSFTAVAARMPLVVYPRMVRLVSLARRPVMGKVSPFAFVIEKTSLVYAGTVAVACRLRSELAGSHETLTDAFMVPGGAISEKIGPVKPARRIISTFPMSSAVSIDRLAFTSQRDPATVGMNDREKCCKPASDSKRQGNAKS